MFPRNQKTNGDFGAPRRVTMADVALRAGVHVTTVSMALRNHPAIPPATRQRLQELARMMGYQRDPVLAALVAYRHHACLNPGGQLLGYITNWDSRWGWKNLPAYRAFYAGAVESAAQLGFRLEHFWLGEPRMSHRRLDGILHSRGITGLILASHRREVEGPLDFEWSRYSAVKIDVSPVRQPLHVVTNDQGAIIMLAMRRALAAGYQRIGLVIPRWWDEHVDLAWSGGYLAYQQKLPRKDRVPILFYADAVRRQGWGNDAPDCLVPRGAFDKWLQAHQPEAVLSCRAFVEERLAEMRLSVPGDLAYADIFLTEPNGRIAGVHENCTRVGALAVEILAGQIQNHLRGIPAVATSTLVEGTWHDGASLPFRRPAAGVNRGTEGIGRSEAAGQVGSAVGDGPKSSVPVAAS